MTPENAKNHFTKRAQKYNHSSHWVDDPILIEKMRDLAHLTSEAYVLDVAVGTGKIAEAFYKKAKNVAGVDICINMARQAKKYTDAVILSPAEKIPFKDNSFDICVCRQGLQFMEIETALSEMYRILKPHGRMVLCHLTAYNERDKETAFLIQSLRNPARKNYFLPEDFVRLLKKINFECIECFEYITKESINQWIDNGSIDEAQMKTIKNIYGEVSEDFKKIHNVEFKNEDIFDSMKMVIAKGIKK